jgi:hypothetical protein
VHKKYAVILNACGTGIYSASRAPFGDGALVLQEERVSYSSFRYTKTIIHPISVSAIVENQKIARGNADALS